MTPLNCFFLQNSYRLQVRNEISDLIEYGQGFDFITAYNLPVAERKLQLMMLKRKLEEKASKQSSDSIVLNENSSLQQIKNLSQKFDKTHEFSMPKSPSKNL